MQSEPAESGRLLGPFESHPLVPVEPTAASHRLGWTGLEATRFSDLGDTEFERPALTHHSLILFTKPPDELDLRYTRPHPLPVSSRRCPSRQAVPRRSWNVFACSPMQHSCHGPAMSRYQSPPAAPSPNWTTAADDRRTIEDILYVLITSSRWQGLPRAHGATWYQQTIPQSTHWLHYVRNDATHELEGRT